MSYFMHQSPEIFHKFETLTNHFIELLVPFFIFLTRPFRITCGILQILFQVRILLQYWPLHNVFINYVTLRERIYPGQTNNKGLYTKLVRTC